MNIVPNNVFLSKEELQVTIASLNNVLRDNHGMSSAAIDMLIGARLELIYALRKMEGAMGDWTY